MRLQDLEFLNTHTVAAGQSFYRVQRARRTSTTVVRGPLKMAPPGLFDGRFDLAGVASGYLAEAPETALYESIFRREATAVSMARIAKYELIAVQLVRAIQVGDLRAHASSWPVLQSLRLQETQQISAEARAAGFDGLMYRSAQQFGQDCLVLFDPPVGAIKGLWRSPLIKQGALNRWVVDAARGSRVPLAP